MTSIRLRRIYLLINTKHGITEFDKAMLQDLNEKLQAKPESRVTLQAILTKIDSLPRQFQASKITEIQAQIFAIAPLCLPGILTAAAKEPRIGIDDLRRSIGEACAVFRK